MTSSRRVNNSLSAAVAVPDNSSANTATTIPTLNANFMAALS